MQDNLVIAGREFRSRLIVGTGKYRSFQEMARCHAASGAEMVTVAVRRVNLTDRSKESLLDYIDREKLEGLARTLKSSAYGQYLARVLEDESATAASAMVVEEALAATGTLLPPGAADAGWVS